MSATDAVIAGMCLVLGVVGLAVILAGGRLGNWVAVALGVVTICNALTAFALWTS